MTNAPHYLLGRSTVKHARVLTLTNHPSPHQNDKDYAIVGECLPYVSQRLLTDPSPRVAGALETFIFGSEAGTSDRVLDAERLDLLLSGFQSYSAAATSTQTPANALAGSTGIGATSSTVSSGPIFSRTVTVLEAVDQLSDLLITAQPTALQGLVVRSSLWFLFYGSISVRDTQDLLLSHPAPLLSTTSLFGFSRSSIKWQRSSAHARGPCGLLHGPRPRRCPLEGAYWAA